MSDENKWAPGRGEDEVDDRTVKRSLKSSAPPEQPGVDIVLDTGVVRSIRGHTLIGRDPTVGPGARLAELVRIDDDAISLSKTHVALDLEDGGLVVSDLGSTNGTSVRSTREGERRVGIGDRIRLEVGDRVHIGDRWFDVGHAGPPPPVQAAVGPVASRCANCGFALQPIDRFCIQCGVPADGRVADVVVEGGRSRSKLVVATVVVLTSVVAAVAGVLIFLRDDGDDAPATASAAPRVPDQPDSVWDVTIDGSASVTGTPGALYVSSTSGSDVEFFRFDGQGSQVWSSRGRGATSGFLVGVAGGHLIAISADDDFEYRMLAFDPATGDEVWSEDLDDDESGGIIDGRLYITTERESSLVDAASGERLERVRGDSTILRGEFFLVRDDDEVEIFDLALSSVADPIRVGDDAHTFAFDGSSLFVADGGEITAYETNGDERWSDDTSHDVVDRIVPASGGRILISGTDGVELTAIDDGRLASAWDHDGSIEGVYTSGGRSLITIYDDDEVLLLDMITGDEIASFDSATWSSTQAGSNAMVVHEFDGDEAVATAISPNDGGELWDLSDEGRFMLVDNGIVRTSYDPSDDETEIEVYE